MLRSIVVRGELVKGQVARKVISGNVARTLATELPKKPFVHNNLIPKHSTPRYSKWIASTSIRCYSDGGGKPHVKVQLPALSPTMEEGTLISWQKKEGDKLNEGDVLAEIETDKATMAFETPEEGYLAKILVPAGSKGVPVGKLVCIIVEKEADVAAFKDFKDDGVVVKPAAATPPSAASAAAPAPPAPQPIAPAAPQSAAAAPQSAGARVYASPMAKRLAEQRNIRLQGKGTGMYDSITSKDLDALAGAAGAATGTPAASIPVAMPAPGQQYVDIPVSNIRAVIAKRLLQSKQLIPHYYLTREVNVDRMLALRARFNDRLKADGVKLSMNDFVLKATALACRKVPETNSAWMDSVIRQYANVDISVAVSTDRGLITPIIASAHTLGVVAINAQMKQLAQRARDGQLQPAEFQGGTITVSNLGMYGVTHFCAIINPPQSCILAVGTTTKKLVRDDERGFRESDVMSVTLCCDHRVVDGALGALWLKAFASYIEDPESMIM